MRKTIMFLFLAMTLMCVAMPVYAQGGAPAPVPIWSLPIGAGIGMGIAAGLCGLGQGRIAGSALEGMARNPGARPGLLIFMIMGLAFVESLALFAFLIVYKLFP